MKFEIKETDHAFYIELKPETTEDYAKLLRITQQSKREPVEVFTSFSSEPYTFIQLRRHHRDKRRYQISNRKQ